MFQNPLPLSVTKNSSPARLNELDEVWYERDYSGQQLQYCAR